MGMVLGVVVAAVPVIVLPGVLSTFEPVKTTLTGLLAVFALVAVVAGRLTGVRSDSVDIGGVVARLAGLRGVRRVTLFALAVYALVTLLATLTSVAPETSWFGTLSRGQGSLFVLAVAVLVATSTDAVRTPAGVGLVLRALAVGSVPVAVATILQRFGLDPITRTLCDVERIPTTIGNALPGATFLGIASLIAFDLLRQAWTAWRSPVHAVAPTLAAAGGAETIHDAGDAADASPGRRRARRALADARLTPSLAAPVLGAVAPNSGPSSWAGPAALLGGAVVALFAGMTVARGDFARTWVAIPLALAWGGAVARATARPPAVPPGLAVAGWAALLALLAVANGLTLSRGPQAALLAGAAVWVAATATLVPGRLSLRAAVWPAAMVAATAIITGASWFIPAIGCGSGPADAAKPPVAAAASATVAPTPAGPTAFARTLDVLSTRMDFLRDPLAAASMGWRTNVWSHALDVYAGQPPTVASRARAVDAALTGAQYGDVVALNGVPGSRAPGGLWYRLIGFGPESQVFVLGTSTSPHVRAVQGEITYDRAHNIVLEVLLTTGAVGLAAWAVHLGGAVLLAWRLRRRTAPGLASPALAPVLVCLFVSGLSGVDATTITLITWVAVAIAIALPPDASSVPASRRPAVAPAPVTRRGVAVPVSGDLVRLGAAGGVALAGCVIAAVAGLGATLPAAWATGAFAGLVIAGLAVADRPFRRGRPDLRVVAVVVGSAAVATVTMLPAWSAMAAGHYARLTQDPTLNRSQITELAKRAVALDPGQATYRALIGS